MIEVLLRDRSIGPAVEWHSRVRQCRLMVRMPRLSFDIDERFAGELVDCNGRRMVQTSKEPV